MAPKPFADCRSSKSSLAPWWAAEALLTMRAGDAQAPIDHGIEKPAERYFQIGGRWVIRENRSNRPTQAGFSHSRSFDQRRRPETFLMAIATAFFCPSRMTSRSPRVTPV